MGDVEIPNWLEGLPLAPEFRPTHTEFEDPIAYISKIEKASSDFGICKIIPPLPKPSKRYVFNNLNKSLSKCPELGSDVYLSNDHSGMKVGSGDSGNEGEARAVFTTRHQELGQSGKRVKGAAVQNLPSVIHKQVWQSGEVYTLEQFETKSRAFSRSILGSVKEVSPLVIEEMFWKTASDKPIYVEYANDVPGSAFEEPVGQFRYSHRRRRKRNSYQRSRENCDSKKSEIISRSRRNSHNNEVKNVHCENVSDTYIEVSKSSAALETLSAEETSRRKNPNACSGMEGTAGWKLSNSPWNLQVIARSAGSLTRFMPDDIPGVTSPMVYIGMLFSWFAWHVEDHELHSMNFLHTGSSKTWYSVPGDYAFAFEELIRTEAFGGNVDRLAALSLLGNKTTLISPELVVAAGIPCCRLIQNPGEFVVTFPRAYHVGFSHGFNCGEAANFGTPQWLKVAKEAAVRRAAMNYLPMLSHQQLLYLLTMSFVSRVPTSLLPGVRSSRRRDRKKEEKELSVKKAFIEDILKENNILSVLLGKDSSYHAVLWNPDLLPYTSKDSVTPSAGDPFDKNPKEDAKSIQCENKNNNDQNFPLDEMSLYMESMNDLYLGSDDLSCDFQVDSGTLACVACGILGFPFMSLVQPSEKASMKLQPEYFLAQGLPGVSEFENFHSSPDCHESVKGCVIEGLYPVSNVLPPEKDPLISSTTNLNRGWNTVNKFLRPRSFCLEHAIEVVELLQCKGGANMLVICHSDYQKIKAPAAAIADEIGCRFNYTEVPLENASKKDLNLIDLAIDDELDEFGEDWTSKLGINLRYCVKVRKSSSSKQVRHALTLDGLFSRNNPYLEFLTVKWESRRSRSKKLSHPAHCTPCESVQKKEELAEGGSDGNSFTREGKIIQYTRRTKLKSGAMGAGKVCRHHDTSGGDHKHGRMASTPSQVSDERVTAISIAGSVVSGSLEERNMNGKGCSLASTESSHMQDEIRILEESSESKSAPMLISADDAGLAHESALMVELSALAGTTNLCAAGSFMASSETQMVNAAMERSFTNNEFCDPMILDGEVQQEIQTANRSKDRELVSGSSHQLDNLTISLAEVYDGCTKETHIAKDDVSSVELKREQVKMLKERIKEHGPSPRRKINEHSPASLGETSGVPKEHCATADFQPGSMSCREEFQTADRSEGEHVCNSVTQPSVPLEESSEVPRVSSCEEGAHTLVQREVQTTTDVIEEPILGLVIEIEKQPTPGLVEEFEVLGMTCSTDGIYGSVALDIKGGWKNQTTNSSEELISTQDTPKCRPYPSIQTYSRVRKEPRAAQNLHKGKSDVCLSKHDKELESIGSSIAGPALSPKMEGKRKRGAEQIMEDNFHGFIRGPCEGLRPRTGKDTTNRRGLDNSDEETDEKPATKKPKKPSDIRCVPGKIKKEEARKKPHAYRCDLENCCMSFETKAELMMHKRNRCPHEGCGKRFSSHSYAMIHSRVHDDDRPLKCPWKGCSMSFKWSWARTEHIRVHTGERPYHCKFEGCGLSFRYVSDFSRHRRKTGHYVT